MFIKIGANNVCINLDFVRSIGTVSNGDTHKILIDTHGSGKPTEIYFDTIEQMNNRFDELLALISANRPMCQF